MPMYQYGGIQGAQTLGHFYVNDAARRLYRMAYVTHRLMMIEAAQLPARMNWHFKAGLARHIYEDSQATKQLLHRCTELRHPQSKQLKEPDPWIALFLDELLMARSDYELWVGIYEILKPALAKVMEDYIVSTQQLVDYPSIRVLKQILMDIKEQLHWSMEIKDILLSDSEFFKTHQEHEVVVDDSQSADVYRRKLLEFLGQAGGLEGDRRAGTEKAPVRWRSVESYQVPKKAVRDPRMGGHTLGRTGVKNPPADPSMALIVESARTRQEEMGASELCAITMVLQPNMPWDFYEDLARHCWDEMRHTLFGQAVLDLGGYDWFSQPQFKGDYDPHTNKQVSVAYTWLSMGIEGLAMRKDGMPKEARQLRKLADQQDSSPFIKLFAQCVDFDWADEVNHHAYGRKWAEPLIGDYRLAESIAFHEVDLNFTRMAKDTIEYWQGRPGGEAYINAWRKHMDPQRLSDIAKA